MKSSTFKNFIVFASPILYLYLNKMLPATITLRYLRHLNDNYLISALPRLVHLIFLLQ